MNKRMKCATLLAIGGVALAGGSSVGAAAPLKPCLGGDTLVATSFSSAALAVDANLNGWVCQSTDRSHGTKKQGPGTKKKGPGGSVSYSYYDDNTTV